MSVGSPTISVALGTYNGAAYLGAQLDSILQQTRVPDEIVICDDASTDATPALLAGYARRCPERIHAHLYQENVGFVRNFERAIAACSGDLIVLSDQDDVWLPARLEAIQAKFDAYPDSAMVVTNASLVDQDLNPLNQTIYTKEKSVELLPEATTGQYGRAIQIKGCTLAFRRRYLPWLLPIPSTLWGHDHWIAALLVALSQVQLIEKPLFLHRRHADNTGSDPAGKGLQYRLRKRRTSMTDSYYQIDAMRWDALADRLISIQTANTGDFSPGRLALGIRRAQELRDHAQRRLELHHLNRLCRVVPVTHLLFKREYHRYSNGVLTYVKDLIS